jgi:multiple sugar transport system permease protein
MAKPTLEAPPSAPAVVPQPVRGPVRNIHLRRRNLWIWAFLMPTVVLYGLYTIYPIIASYWYSLVEWNGFESEQRFVGISNYEAVLADPGFWNSVWITLAFMLLVAPARVVLSLLLAIVLNSPRLPFAALFRTVYFLPVVTTTAIVGVVMQFVFDPASGPVNSALQTLGQSRGINFLGDSGIALLTVSAVYVWKFFGITMATSSRAISGATSPTCVRRCGSSVTPTPPTGSAPCSTRSVEVPRSPSTTGRSRTGSRPPTTSTPDTERLR